MGRLTGQETEGDTLVEDPVVVYLAHVDTGEGVDATVIQAHIDEAIILSREVDMAARSLVQSGGAFSRSSLSRDIEVVETAIGHTRRAADLFDRTITSPRL